MKYFFVLSFWIITLNGIFSITYLRPKNDRGPGIGCLKCFNLTMILSSTLLHYEGAMRAGTDCITHAGRYFFVNDDDASQQIQNLAVFHTKNMTSPAMEIEIEYLWILHNRILDQEKDETTFQLKVLSNKPVNRSFADIALTDYYVLVADNIDNVRENNFTKTFNLLNCF